MLLERKYMHICYIDGSTKKDGIVVVSGVLGVKNERYEKVSEILYCFKKNFEIPYGYSLHEELALLNALKEIGKTSIDFSAKSNILFINDSMNIYKLLQKNEHLNIFEHIKSLVKKYNDNNPNNENQDMYWHEKIEEEFKELKNTVVKKEQFLYAKRSNVGISIANKLNKEIDCFVKENAMIYLKSSLNKITSRHYLYDEIEKR